MKLVLHIGMPKAGSTALQQTLGAAESRLQRHGICFPAGGSLPKNHNLLICGLLSPAALPRLFRQIYANDARRMQRDFESFMTGLHDRVRKSGAHTVILSGEMLFRKLGPRKIATLREILAPFSGGITVVAYVRSPAQFYMSQVQQVLKASQKIVPPGPRDYRAPLESYEALTEDIRVIPYARDKLYEGDITRDFLHRLFPDLDGSLIKARHIRDSNQTISAEGIDILQKYRMYNHPENDGKFTPDTSEVLKLIAATEAEIGGFTKPVAHGPLQDYLARASLDLLWLRDRHGVEFDGVDYAAIGGETVSPPVPESVSDICSLDPALRDRLMMVVMNHLARKASKDHRIRFKTSMPKPA